MIKITCRTQEQRRRQSGFSGKYYLKAVEIFHRKLRMSLTGEAERSYLRTYISAVMEPGHVIVTGCRCRNSEVMPSAAAEGIQARPHPAPVMGGRRQPAGRGCRGEAGKRRPGSARLPQGRAPARGKRFRRGDMDTSVGSLDTFYTESTRISVHRRKRFFRTVKNPAIMTLGSRKKPKAFELQQSSPASPCGGFRNCIPCVRPNMPEAPSGRPACGQKKSGAVPPPRRAAMRPTLPNPCSRTRSRGRASTLCTGCRRHRCRPCAAPAGSPLSP